MSWKVKFTYEGQQDLNRLDEQIKSRIIDKIIWLSENFEQIFPRPLSEEWRGLFKLRVGDWRVIYDYDKAEKQIVIHRIDKRDKIYKRKK